MLQVVIQSNEMEFGKRAQKKSGRRGNQQGRRLIQSHRGWGLLWLRPVPCRTVVQFCYVKDWQPISDAAEKDAADGEFREFA